MAGVKGRKYRSNRMMCGYFPASLLLLLVMTSLPRCTVAYSDPNEVAAMLTFVAALPDIPRVTKAFQVNTDMCLDWQKACGYECPVNFACDPTNTHILLLTLSGSIFNSGTISPAIKYFTQLQYLTIDRTLMSGPIPIEITQLPSLRFLQLTNNKFSGSLSWLPQCNSASLVSVSLTSNQFSGPIPPDIDRLSNLQQLLLGDNQLQGPLPSSLANLDQLASLDLGINYIGGNIPSWLSGMDNLQVLNLAQNYLSGPLPPQLSNMDSLNELHLESQRGKTKLTGSIPKEYGSFRNLLILKLAQNQLTGSIPSSLVKIVSQPYGVLDLAYNLLSGSVPSAFRNLAKIDTTAQLSLDGNLLQGPPFSFKVPVPGFTNANNCFNLYVLKCMTFYNPLVEGSSLPADGAGPAPSQTGATPLGDLLQNLPIVRPFETFAPAPSPDRRLTLEEVMARVQAVRSRELLGVGLVIGVAAAAVLGMLAMAVAILSRHSVLPYPNTHTSIRPPSGPCQLPLLTEVRGANSESVLTVEGGQEGYPAAPL